MKVEVVRQAQRPMPIFAFGKIKVQYLLRITTTEEQEQPQEKAEALKAMAEALGKCSSPQ